MIYVWCGDRAEEGKSEKDTEVEFLEADSSGSYQF